MVICRIIDNPILGYGVQRLFHKVPWTVGDVAKILWNFQPQQPKMSKGGESLICQKFDVSAWFVCLATSCYMNDHQCSFTLHVTTLPLPKGGTSSDHSDQVILLSLRIPSEKLRTFITCPCWFSCAMSVDCFLWCPWAATLLGLDGLIWMSHDSYHNVHQFSRFSGAKQNGQRMKRNVTVMTMMKAGHDPAKCFESWRANCVLDWLCFGHVSHFNTCVPLLDLAKIVSCINSCHVLPEKGYQKFIGLSSCSLLKSPTQELVSGEDWSGPAWPAKPFGQLSNANGTKTDVFLRHEEI